MRETRDMKTIKKNSKKQKKRSGFEKRKVNNNKRFWKLNDQDSKKKRKTKKEIGIWIKKGDERNLIGREEKGKQFGL